MLAGGDDSLAVRTLGEMRHTVGSSASDFPAASMIHITSALSPSQLGFTSGSDIQESKPCISDCGWKPPRSANPAAPFPTEK